MKKQFGFDFEKKILNRIFEIREEDIYEITDDERELNNKKLAYKVFKYYNLKTIL